VNITPASSEIIGENRVEGTIAVVARQQQNNGVSFFSYFSVSLNIPFLVRSVELYARWQSYLREKR